jgi:peroxiredoxin Q/BCP
MSLQSPVSLPAELPDFELPNAGSGPETLSMREIVETVDVAVVLLLRDYHCPKCRAQVQEVAEAAEALNKRDAAPIAILPDSYEKAADWQDSYDLPFPLLADPAAEVGDEADQPRRFGVFGKLHDVIGRMPKTMVLDCRSEEPTIAHVHEGSTPADRPEIEDLIEVIDDLQTSFVFDCDLVDC